MTREIEKFCNYCNLFHPWTDTFFKFKDGNRCRIQYADYQRKYNERKTRDERLINKIKTIESKIPSFIKLDPASCVLAKKTKVRFIDDLYGEFWAVPGDVYKGSGHRERGKVKRKATNLKKYGNEHALSTPAIKAKVVQTSIDRYGCSHPNQRTDARHQRKNDEYKIETLLHWKTGAAVRCVASYESAVVNYLNDNQIDFEWQIRFFIPEMNRYYFVDLYLPKANLYVEIKGYFRRELSRQKWEWFHKEHPNSELWNKEVLLNMGIKIRK